MKYYDVFNGDADGICALHQFRLANPVEGVELITGVKREIALLSQIEDVKKCNITVFDVSMHSNITQLRRLLDAENNIVYIDHHFAGEIPKSPNLYYQIDPSPELCTSLIVNRMLDGAYFKWSICGAFGDNLEAAALDISKKNGLSQSQILQLKEVGELINYNGYGAKREDLYFQPDRLYRIIREYQDPLAFYNESQALRVLKAGFDNDMNHALSQPEYQKNGKNKVYRFPDSPWARRVSGVFANLKARENPSGAHALITENSDSSLRISVRAPLVNKNNADILCRAFPTGGGRAAAAGINALPAEQLDSFLKAFKNIYS